MSLPDGYEAAVEQACALIFRLLVREAEAQRLDALELWERYDPPNSAAFEGLSPDLTALQWSVALDVARAQLGLRELARRKVVVAGVMAHPATRLMLRITAGKS